MGLVLSLLPLLAGAVWVVRVCGLKAPLYYLPLGAGIGWTLTLILADLLLKAGLSLHLGLSLTFALLALLSLWGLQGANWGERAKTPLTFLSWLYLAGGSVLIWFTSVSILLLSPDGDYWIHAPMQAQMLQGDFPPRNPYFSEVIYGGHYARDFLAVIVSWCTGSSLFVNQIPVSALLQLTAFFNLFLAGLRYGGGQLAGVLLSAYVFTGVNAGPRQGWLDTLANNTSLANMHTSLVIFLLLRALYEKVNAAEIVVTGVLFAGLAWSYETNFVSLSLALLMLALLTALRGRLTRRQLKVSALLVACALAVLLVQGGSIGHLLASPFRADAQPQAELDDRQQAQNQRVSVRFPKERLFEISVVRPGEDLSIAYLTVPGVKKLFVEPGELGTMSIFSPQVWKIHWLAFYLCPLVFVYLWKRFDPLGLLFFSYGLTSFVLPAVVDFGIFEAEVFRWQFAASWGFAGALAVALALWLGSCGGAVFRRQEGYLVLGRGEGAALLVVLLTYFNSYPALEQVARRSALLPDLTSGFLPPSESQWLFSHPILGVTPADLEVSRLLSEQAQARDTFLTNFRERNFDNMMEENTLVGLSGVRPLGHALPLRYEPLGTPPFRQNAMARAYWATGDESLLRNSPPRWLYFRSGSPGMQPEESSRCELVTRHKDKVQEVSLYQLDLAAFPTIDRELPASQVKVSQLRSATTFHPEEYHSLSLQLHNQGEREVQGERYLAYAFSDEPNEEGLVQVVDLDLSAEAKQTARIHFVTPHHAGTYKVFFYWQSAAGREAAGEFEIEVEGGPSLEDLEIVALSLDKPLMAAMLGKVELQVVNRGVKMVDFEGLASLRLESAEGPRQSEDFQALRIRLAPGERTLLPLYLPALQGAGTWPLYLSLEAKFSRARFQLGQLSVALPADEGKP